MSNSQKERARYVDRRLQALELRKQGKGPAEIGRLMGITRQSAHEMINKALKEVVFEAVDDYRKVNLSRLETMLDALWVAVLEGDVRAQEAARGHIAEMNKLAGTYAPVKQDVVLEDASLSDTDRLDRLAALLERARTRRAGQAAGNDAGLLAGSAPESEAA